MSIYLIASYSIKPKSSVRTQLAGWMNNPNNVSYDESVAISRKIKPKDLQMSKIIIDFTHRKIVKNGWADNRTFEDLFNYFYQGYPNYINPILKELGYSVHTIDRAVATTAEVTDVTPQPTGTSLSSS